MPLLNHDQKRSLLRYGTGIGGVLLLVGSLLGLHGCLDIRYDHSVMMMIIAMLASTMTSGLVSQNRPAQAADEVASGLRALLVMASAIITMTIILLIAR